METELKNDLVTSWNEIDEALESLALVGSDLKEAKSAIIERLENAQILLGKYVSEDDILEDL